MKSYRWIPVGLAAFVGLTGCSADMLKSLLGGMGGGQGQSGQSTGQSTGPTEFAGTWYTCGSRANFTEDPQGNIQGQVFDQNGQFEGSVSGHAQGKHASLDFTPNSVTPASSGGVFSGSSGVPGGENAFRQTQSANRRLQDAPRPEHAEMDLAGSTITGTVDVPGGSPAVLTLTRQPGMNNGACNPNPGPTGSPQPGPTTYPGPTPYPTPMPYPTDYASPYPTYGASPYPPYYASPYPTYGASPYPMGTPYPTPSPAGSSWGTATPTPPPLVSGNVTYHGCNGYATLDEVINGTVTGTLYSNLHPGIALADFSGSDSTNNGVQQLIVGVTSLTAAANTMTGFPFQPGTTFNGTQSGDFLDGTAYQPDGSTMPIHWATSQSELACP